MVYGPLKTLSLRMVHLKVPLISCLWKKCTFHCPLKELSLKLILKKSKLDSSQEPVHKNYS